MLMRKINAVVSLLTAALLLDHAIFHAVYMLSRGAAEGGPLMSWLLLGLMLTHAVISIDLAISANTGAEKRKCKVYPKLNAVTLFQRIGGIALILFAGWHAAGAAGLMQVPRAVHAALSPLFFTLALAHAAVSTSKALITLGIGSARAVKAVDVAVKVICVAALIASLVGFYLYKV